MRRPLPLVCALVLSLLIPTGCGEKKQAGSSGGTTTSGTAPIKPATYPTNEAANATPPREPATPPPEVVSQAGTPKNETLDPPTALPTIGGDPAASSTNPTNPTNPTTPGDSKPASPNGSSNAPGTPGLTPGPSHGGGATPATQPQGRKLYRIAMIGRTQSSVAAHAARAGAEDAAADYSSRLGADLKLVWQTPSKEDPARQAAIVEQAVSSGVHGIVLSSSNSGVLASAVQFAKDRGVPVVCFESDAPGSMAFVGADEQGVGRAVMQDLAAAMGEKGTFAVLAGPESDAVAQARLRGLKSELLNYPGMKLQSVATAATADEGALKLEQARASAPSIAGWAVLGTWPSLTESDLTDIAKTAKVVSADAFPQQLRYVETGQVQSLVAQDYYAWGYESVRLLAETLNDLSKGGTSGPVRVEIERVTRDNAADMEAKWERWLKGIGK